MEDRDGWGERESGKSDEDDIYNLPRIKLYCNLFSELLTGIKKFKL